MKRNKKNLLLTVLTLAVMISSCTDTDQALLQTAVAEAGQTAISEGEQFAKTQAAQLKETAVAAVKTQVVQLKETVQAGIATQTNRIESTIIAQTSAQPPMVTCELNDLLYPHQWNMHVIDLVGALNQFPDCKVDPVNVAVIDTGIDFNHPELEQRVTNTGESIEDINGHGTQVSGIIAAIQNNGIGIAGIHPNAQLRVYKISTGDSLFAIADTIRKAVDEGARVINLSIGRSSDPASVLERAITYAENHNPPVIIVAAAAESANANPGEIGVVYPAYYAFTHNNVIAVSSSTIDNKLASYSMPGIYLTIAAPGGQGSGRNYECLSGIDDCIISLYLKGNYKEGQGTSMAAPHVTGVIALMLAANPSLTPCQVKSTLIRRASAFSAPANGFPGNGILNAGRALEAVKQGDIECVSVP